MVALDLPGGYPGFQGGRLVDIPVFPGIASMCFSNKALLETSRNVNHYPFTLEDDNILDCIIQLKGSNLAISLNSSLNFLRDNPACLITADDPISGIAFEAA